MLTWINSILWTGVLVPVCRLSRAWEIPYCFPYPHPRSQRTLHPVLRTHLFWHLSVSWIRKQIRKQLSLWITSPVTITGFHFHSHLWNIKELWSHPSSSQNLWEEVSQILTLANQCSFSKDQSPVPILMDLPLLNWHWRLEHSIRKGKPLHQSFLSKEGARNAM